MSIDYAFRPCLRIRLTPGGRTCPGKPWDSGDRDSHPVFRYSCPHNRLHAVHGGFRHRFVPHATLPYQPLPRKGRFSSFGTVLTPDHFRRGVSRPVSCYAMFKWWLPLSQHPGCHRDPTSFVTEHGLGALAGSLGCFPFDDGTYLSPSISPALCHRHSEFARRRYLARGLRSNSALPSMGTAGG